MTIEKIGKNIEEKKKNFFTNVLSPFMKRTVPSLWVPLTTALTALILFAFVDQTLEIYRSFALDKDKSKIVWSTLCVLLLSLVVWYSARLLALEKVNKENPIDTSETLNEKTLRITLQWLPRILGLLPLGGMAIGIARITPEESSPLKVWLFLWWLFVCLLLVFLVVLFFRKRIFRKIIEEIPLTQLFSKNPENSLDNHPQESSFSQEEELLGDLLDSRPQKGLFSQEIEYLFVTLLYLFLAAVTLPLVSYVSSFFSIGVFWVFFLCLCAFLMLKSWSSDPESFPFWIPFVGSIIISVVFWFFLPPVFLPTRLGPIIISAIALTFMTVFFSTIYQWGQRDEVNLPAVSILIILAVFWSAFSLNDNHQIRHIEPSNDTDQIELLSLEESFEDWLSSPLRNLDKFKTASSEDNSNKYPVYVVSAEGGGIFAAYHAAILLSRLNDTIPGFSEHVFAISSVSGGSIGATAYSSLVKNNIDADNDVKTIEDKARTLLDRDFLSPVLAMGLFPDFIQRFIPFKINDWDRARGLEVALEESWRISQDSPEPSNNPLKQSYSDFWNPSGFAPALVLNTTIAETGERLLFSPFKFETSAKIFDFKEANFDIPLSTAAALSARFPLVTPVGLVNAGINNYKGNLHLGDGGYFDNSGVATAIDITNALGNFLSEMEKEHGIQLKIVNLAIIDRDNVRENPGWEGLNELLSPVRALFNVREARETSSVQKAEFSLNRGISDPADLSSDRFRKFLLDREKAYLPLGWLLSHTSQQEIDQQISDYKAYKECKNNKKEKEFDVSNHNSCVAKSIYKDLI